ncbi:MAG: hypothetical protein EXS09_21020 [Gemmataceae bacterium]|nr:hypothetical protein [Gemmataceae bacterium]
MKSVTPVLMFLLVATTELIAQSPAKHTDDAIARIEKLGGAVRKISQGSDALEVDLQGSTVTDADLKDLVLLKNVQVIRLKETKIGDAGLEYVSKIATLKRLFLDKTAVTDAGLSRLGGLKNLEFLSLYGTAVGDAGLEHLKKIASLKTVIVTESKVTANGADAFRKTIPKLQVIPNLAQDSKQAVAAWKTAKAALENAKAELDAAKKEDAELTPKIAKLKAEAEEANKKSAEVKKKADDARKVFEEANKKANEFKKGTEELKKQLLKNPSDAKLKEYFEKQSARMETAAKEALPLKRTFEEAQAAALASMAQAKELGQMAGRAGQAKKRAEETQKRFEAMRLLEEYNRAVLEKLEKGTKFSGDS